MRALWSNKSTEVSSKNSIEEILGFLTVRKYIYIKDNKFPKYKIQIRSERYEKKLSINRKGIVLKILICFKYIKSKGTPKSALIIRTKYLPQVFFDPTINIC